MNQALCPTLHALLQCLSLFVTMPGQSLLRPCLGVRSCKSWYPCYIAEVLYEVSVIIYLLAVYL
jgi:hypothetical protein